MKLSLLKWRMNAWRKASGSRWGEPAAEVASLSNAKAGAEEAADAREAVESEP